MGGAVIPLYAGSVHYWRLDPRDWRPCLEAVKALGFYLIDIYIPWSVHEVGPGVLELGERDPQRDVGAFLRLVRELGMYAIVRPGPHINGELTYFGIPERVVYDPHCQARTPSGNPVMLPMVPFAFPVPSYASDAFLDETTRYFQALAPALAPLVHPAGPIVLLQIDNEGSLYFRDGAYDQDYHPDAIRQYRGFLRDKYKTLDALHAAYPSSVTAGSDQAPESGLFATLAPPTRFDATTPAELARHLDWAEFQEHMLARAFERFSQALKEAGLAAVPTTHNFPMAQETGPLNAERIGRSIDLVGLDYYYKADVNSRMTIARRTSELAVRCEAHGVPAFACELGAGFPPFFPPLEEQDSAFTVLTALAYGLRGYNLYMAVERDRWIGAPIDCHGRARPFAAFWRKLTAALEKTQFHTLTRHTPVRLMTPRSQRRLARVMHAFGSLPSAFFSIIGAGPRESCFEDDLGLGYPIAIEADTFTRAFEQALDGRGVPYAHVGGEERGSAIEGARWVVCATTGGLHPNLFEALAHASAQGTSVTLGPRAPAYDGSLRALSSPLDLTRLEVPGGLPPILFDDTPAAADALVSKAIERLELPTYACDPDGIYATVHDDPQGKARVLFVMNPGADDVLTRVTVGREVRRATDLFDASTTDARRGTFELRMRPRMVRMFALD